MDCSHRKVRILLEELIDLRKNALQDISDVYAQRNKSLLKYLNGVKIIQRENDDIKLMIDPFENLNMKQIFQDNGLVEKIYDQIKLLKILIIKKNCPISKIIDDI